MARAAAADTPPRLPSHARCGLAWAGRDETVHHEEEFVRLQTDILRAITSTSNNAASITMVAALSQLLGPEFVQQETHDVKPGAQSWQSCGPRLYDTMRYVACGPAPRCIPLPFAATATSDIG